MLLNVQPHATTEQCTSRTHPIVTEIKENSDPTVTQAAQRRYSDIKMTVTAAAKYRSSINHTPPDSYPDAEPKINQCVLGLSSKVTSRNVKQLP